MIINSFTVVGCVEIKVEADVLVSVFTCVCNFLDQVWDVLIALVFTLLILDLECELDLLEAMAVIGEDGVGEISHILCGQDCYIYL